MSNKIKVTSIKSYPRSHIIKLVAWVRDTERNHGTIRSQLRETLHLSAAILQINSGS
jgi:hypothetical protein